MALDFTREDSVVDLHWRLSPGYFPFAPEGEQVWDRTAEIELLGRCVRVLGPIDSILFQAYHGSKHGWTTLAQICDFARVLTTAKRISWPSLLDDSRRTHSLRMLLLGVNLAHSLSLCEMPAELLDAASQESPSRVAQSEGNAGDFRFKEYGRSRRMVDRARDYRVTT